MKAKIILKSLFLGFLLLPCAACNDFNTYSNSNDSDSKENFDNNNNNNQNIVPKKIDFNEENLDGLEINSVAKMNYYLGKTLVATNGNTNDVQKAYKKVGYSLKKLGEDNTSQGNSEDLNVLPEGIDDPYEGTKEIESIDDCYDIHYKDGTIAYYKSIENYTISFAFSFKFELEDSQNYLAEKIGTGTIYCVITDFGIGMASFRNGDKFYCCLQDCATPGYVANSFTFRFGREYIGMYFCKGDCSSENLGRITFDNLLDLSSTSILIGGGDNNRRSSYPQFDNDYASFVKIKPITLTWEEYEDLIMGTLVNGVAIGIEDESNQSYQEWANKLKFDNATIDVSYLDGVFVGTYYYVDGIFYLFDGNKYTECECPYMSWVTERILNDIGSIVQTSENSYRIDRDYGDITMEFNNGAIYEIKTTLDFYITISNIGSTVLAN